MFTKRNQSAQPQSPCGLAFDHRNGQIVIAEYAANGGFDIYRAVLGERRSVNLESSDLRTTFTKGNAHTDALSLPISPDAAEEDILRTIIERTQGDQSHVLAFTRTPDARIVVTQVEALAVTEIVRRTEQWLDDQRPEHAQPQEKTLRAETRTRAITRLWRASLGDIQPTGTAAILVIGDNDYAIGLWSEQTGLVYETEELFEPGAGIEIKCQHARDVFTKFVAPASLAKLKLPEVTNAVLSAADGYADSMLALLNESPELDGIRIEHVSINIGDATRLDQPTAFAIGSLLDHETIPACNLAVTPQMRLDEIERERKLKDRTANSHKARAAVLAILIPLVAVIAFTMAAWMDNGIEHVRLNSRINEETLTGQKLAQANSDYESSKANFAAFHSLLDNLITLRQRQPAAHQLLNDLNQRWPQDPTWYISEINVKGANVEIKGKTKNEQAITSFAKSLEFSNGLFTGILTRNNVEGNSPNSAPQQQNQPPRSSVIEFTILSTYAPLATPGKAVTTTAQPQQMGSLQQPSLTNGPQAGPKPATSPSVLPSGPIPNLPVPPQSQGTK
jgi:Tfp pilus assembly protein PilN